MTDTPKDAPPLKKRSLFKRAAWQDSPTNDEDIFSHSKDFKHIVAQQKRYEAEKKEAERKKKAEEGRERKRKLAATGDRKRSKVSHDNESVLTGSASGSSPQANETCSKARSQTPLSPVNLRDSSPAPAPSRPPPDSLSTRYDNLAKAAPSSRATRSTPSVVVDISDSDDDFPEPSDPGLAAIAARARARIAEKARIAALVAAGEEVTKAPIVQLLIQPEIPNTRPLVVKVRTDHTLEKTRLAWCEKQGFSPAQTQAVFFTSKGKRMFDSTTVQRLGLQIDEWGNVEIEGDLNVYNNDNPAKVYVQAWTDELFKKHQEEEAAAATAKQKAAELALLPPRTPTPEPVKKWKLILKAKGKEDWGITVKPDSTFAHIAHAYKKARNIDESQPVTLIFDGERLVPMDVIADSDLEDMDSIDVVFR
ncbi:hypothetical protein HBI47_060530 [Parastagonospora nodorum]|nr:hypothetical protein HBI47_060530 [Parastagonospora nodorum]